MTVGSVLNEIHCHQLGVGPPVLEAHGLLEKERPIHMSAQRAHWCQILLALACATLATLPWQPGAAQLSMPKRVVSVKPRFVGDCGWHPLPLSGHVPVVQAKQLQPQGLAMQLAAGDLPEPALGLGEYCPASGKASWSPDGGQMGAAGTTV